MSVLSRFRRYCDIQGAIAMNQDRVESPGAVIQCQQSKLLNLRSYKSSFQEEDHMREGLNILDIWLDSGLSCARMIRRHGHS